MTTINSESGSLIAGGFDAPNGWSGVFTPRRPGETVGNVTVTRDGFVFTSSVNLDVPETVKAFWIEAEKAEDQQNATVDPAKLAAMQEGAPA